MCSSDLNTCGSASASKVVTVIQAPSPGTISGATNVCTGLTITLSDPVAGGTWSSSNSAVASVSAVGIVAGVSAGTATISYTFTNTCGSRSATHPVAVLSHSDCNTFVNGPSAFTEELQVYPNPNQGVYTMKLITENEVPVTVVITNVIGKKVKEFTTTSNKTVEIQMNTQTGRAHV